MSIAIRTVFIASLALNSLVAGAAIYFAPKALEAFTDIRLLLDAFVERRAGSFENSNVSKADIVFLGDSITHEGLWSEYFPDKTVLNRGVSGDTVADVIDRLAATAPLRPEKMFVLVGINDLNKGRSAAETVGDYDQLFQDIETMFPSTTVIIQSVMPTNDSWIFDVAREDVVVLNAHLQEIAGEYGFEYLDVATPLSDEAGRLRRDVTNDGIHLNSKGYRVWLSVISPLVEGD